MDLDILLEKYCINCIIYSIYSLLNSDEGLYAIEREKIISELLDDFQKQVYDSWTSTLPSKLILLMKKPLITKDSNNILSVNFDIDLIIALKDIKNIKFMKDIQIPDKILQFFNLEDYFWKYRIRLSRITEWYNYLLTNIVPCEFDLIKKDITSIDENLEPALRKYDWNDIDDEYTLRLYERIKNLYDRVRKAEINKNWVLESVKSWGTRPLFHRKGMQPSALFNFDDRENILWTRLKNCQITTELIREVLEENFRLFFNAPIKVIQKSEISSVGSMKMVKDGESLKESLDGQELAQDSQDDEDEGNLKNYLYSSDSMSRTSSQNILFRAYEEYFDDLLGKELMKSINTRFESII